MSNIQDFIGGSGGMEIFLDGNVPNGYRPIDTLNGNDFKSELVNIPIGPDLHSRFHICLAGYNDGNSEKVIVYGGIFKDADGVVRSTRAIIEYDIKNKYIKDLPVYLNRYAATTHIYNDGTNNKLLIFSGAYIDANGITEHNDTVEYNIDTGTWTSLSPGYNKRHHSSIYFNDGSNKVIVTGGYQDGIITGKTYLYNVDTDTWSTLSDCPEALVIPSVAYFKDGNVNKMITLGGHSDVNSSYTDSIYEYNIDTDTWTLYDKLPFKITDLSNAVYKNINNEHVFIFTAGTSILPANTTDLNTKRCNFMIMYNYTTKEIKFLPNTNISSSYRSFIYLYNDNGVDYILRYAMYTTYYDSYINILNNIDDLKYINFYKYNLSLALELADNTNAKLAIKVK